MKTWIKVLIITGAVLFFQLIMGVIVWGTKSSWWWFWGAFILEVIIIRIYSLIVFFKRKPSEEKTTPKEPLKKKIIQRDAKTIVENILVEEYAQHIEKPQERISHIGKEGTSRTPFYIYWGRPYYDSDRKFYVILNMADPTQKAVLIQGNSEKDKKFNARVKDAMNELAQEPETYETKTAETSSPTGVTTKVTKKKQSKADIEKKKQEEEKEKAEVIGDT